MDCDDQLIFVSEIIVGLAAVILVRLPSWYMESFSNPSSLRIVRASSRMAFRTSSISFSLRVILDNAIPALDKILHVFFEHLPHGWIFFPLI